mmetsp:Transcript_3270/g.9276  ORF Transcript_3270/g.9276 Transcript_3270/m.9276 type:complete len:288 (-) Transcript_3270:1783-2646(-)
MTTFSAMATRTWTTTRMRSCRCEITAMEMVAAQACTVTASSETAKTATTAVEDVPSRSTSARKLEKRLLCRLPWQRLRQPQRRHHRRRRHGIEGGASKRNRRERRMRPCPHPPPTIARTAPQPPPPRASTGAEEWSSRIRLRRPATTEASCPLLLATSTRPAVPSKRRTPSPSPGTVVGGSLSTTKKAWCRRPRRHRPHPGEPSESLVVAAVSLPPPASPHRSSARLLWPICTTPTSLAVDRPRCTRMRLPRLPVPAGICVVKRVAMGPSRDGGGIRNRAMPTPDAD